jgi:hypothetical protein
MPIINTTSLNFPPPKTTSTVSTSQDRIALLTLELEKYPLGSPYRKVIEMEIKALNRRTDTSTLNRFKNLS